MEIPNFHRFSAANIGATTDLPKIRNWGLLWNPLQAMIVFRCAILCQSAGAAQSLPCMDYAQSAVQTQRHAAQLKALVVLATRVMRCSTTEALDEILLRRGCLSDWQAVSRAQCFQGLNQDESWTAPPWMVHARRNLFSRQIWVSIDRTCLLGATFPTNPDIVCIN